MGPAFAVDHMSRLADAFAFTALCVSAATDKHAHLAATDNLLLRRNNFFLRIGHCQGPFNSVPVKIEIGG
jgi:hypothetical protein